MFSTSSIPFNQSWAQFRILGFWMLAILAVNQAHAQSSGDGRPWTAEDSIKIRYFADDLRAPTAWPVTNWSTDPKSGASEIWFSPGGGHFFFLSHWGDLKANCNHYRLEVFSSAQVQEALRTGARAPAPLRTIEATSTTTQYYRWLDPTAFTGGIADIRWEDDHTLIYTLAPEEWRGAIYRMDVRTGVAVQLTPEGTNPVSTVNINGDGILYESYELIDLPSYKAREPIQFARGNFFLGRLGPRGMMRQKLFAGYRGRLPQAIAVVEQEKPTMFNPRLSPDGRWGVISMPVFKEDAAAESVEIPTGWVRYVGISGTDSSVGLNNYDRNGLADCYGSYRRLARTTLVDMETGALRSLIDAPIGALETNMVGKTNEVFWTKDEEHLIVTNQCLPLDSDAPTRAKTSYIVDFDLIRNGWTVVAPTSEEMPGGTIRRIASMRWLESDTSMLAKYVDSTRKPAGNFVFSRGPRGAWQRREATAEELTAITGGDHSQLAAVRPQGLTVSLRESHDQSPMIVATDGNHELSLTRPDPALAGLAVATGEVVDWPERGEITSQGRLYLPRQSATRTPVPLVVQIQNDPTAPTYPFRPDGEASGVYATQLLVAQGMAVLQINGNIGDVYPEHTGDKWFRGERTDAESPYECGLLVKRIDAAVKALARRGLIDPDKVGLVGFSRHGMYTNYIMRHPGEITLAAAVVGDSYTPDYSAFIFGEFLGTTHPARGNGPEMYGGTPWTARATWLAEAPGLSLAKIETPLLVAQHLDNLQSILFNAERCASLQTQQREVDFIIIPKGCHQFALPTARKASLEATVDWMNFWLQDRDDSNPTKREQYRYWRLLKKQRDERWRKEGSPYNRTGTASAMN